jgi:hypothetical protein
MPTPLVYLVDPLTELEQFGLSYEFLDQFVPRPVEVEVIVGGALGVAQFAWRNQGAPDYGNPRQSQAAAPWQTRLSDVFADVTFTAGTYVANEVYTIDEIGNVTHTGTGPAITAARFDQRLAITKAVSLEALSRMAPNVTPPVYAVGDEIKLKVAAIVAYELKSTKGLAPLPTEVGDNNLLVRAKEARDYLDAIGDSDQTPQGVVDSTPTTQTDDLFAAVSDDPRDW